MTTKTAWLNTLGGGATAFARRDFTADSATNTIGIPNHGRKTGDGPFRLVVGEDYSSQLPTGLHPQRADGVRLTLAGAQADNTVVTLAGREYRFVIPDNLDGEIGAGNVFEQATGIRDSVNGVDSATTPSTTTAHDMIVAESQTSTTCNFRARRPGLQGNQILFTEAEASLSLNQARLTGGTDPVDYWLIKVDDDTLALALSQEDALAETAVTFSDNGAGTMSLQLTLQELADEVEEVVAHLTSPGGRVMPLELNRQRFWQAMIDGVV